MAYLVVADVADHTVRKPWGFQHRWEAQNFLNELALDALEDGFHAVREEDSLRVISNDGSETYRIVETSDEKLLRMAQAAPPSSRREPDLP